MSNRAKLFVPIVFFLVMAGLLVYGLSRDPNVAPSAMVNHPLPEFSQPALFQGEGNDQGFYTTADLRGNLTILNVWGSWCAPCHVEHPFLMDVSEQEDDITFVGVTYDYSVEPDREFLNERGNPFDISVVDMDGSLRIDLGVTGAPETFLIDANGIILYRHIGAIDHVIWDEKFAPLIAGLQE